MKCYEIEMDIHFSKTVRVQAPDEDGAIALAEATLMCTDALALTDEDMVGLISSAKEIGGWIDDENEFDEEEEDCDADCASCILNCTGEYRGPAEDAKKPMSLEEMMLHLSMYVEDARDVLDSVEEFAQAIIREKNSTASPKRPNPSVQ